MSYIILVNSRKKAGEKIALVDRSRFREQWWTENVCKAKVFESKEEADSQCKKIKFNNPTVYTYEKGKVRLGQVEVRKKGWLEKALDRKMQEWHDDDWYEGIND